MSKQTGGILRVNTKLRYLMNEDLFRPLKKGRLSEEIVNYIKKLIVEGKLKPLDKLPSESDLAARFNVGRSAARTGSYLDH